MNRDPLEGLPAGSLEPQLRASIDMAEKRYHARELERQQREVKLALTICRHSAFAIEHIAAAIAWPRISRKSLLLAQVELQAALEAAEELDPEPESA